MANRYWVGGTNTWSLTAGTKWSATSGGAGGASVPGASDDVFFDANSGSGTITKGTSNGVNSLNTTGFTGTFTGSGGLGIQSSSSGSLTIGTGTTWTLTGIITFSAAGTKTVTTNGKTLGPIVINGSGQTVTLQDALTCNSSITVTQGTFDTNNQTVTAESLSSSNSNTRSILLGSSTVTLTGSTSSVLSFATETNLTFNAGTSTVVLTGSSATITGNTRTFYNLTFSGASNLTSGAFTVSNDLTLSGSGTHSISSSITVNNLVASGFSGTLQGSGAFNITGNLTLGASMTFSHVTGMTFTATSSGRTITTAGVAVRGVTFNGSGGWILQDALSLQSGYDLTFAQGDLDTNDQSVTVRSFVFSGSGTKVLTLGSSVIECNRGSAGAFYAWDSSAASNLTINAGTSEIVCSGSNPFFAAGGETLHDVTLSGTVSSLAAFALDGTTLTGTASFTQTGPYVAQLDSAVIDTLHAAAGSTIGFIAGSTFDVAVMDVDGTSGNETVLESYSGGGTWYITSSSPSIDCNYIDLSDSAASGTTFEAGANSIDSGGNTGWTFGAGGDQFLTGTGYANTSAYGSGTLTAFYTLTGTGLANTSAFGSGVVTPGAVTITGTGLSLTTAFGTGTLTATYAIAGTGIAPTATMGGGALAASNAISGTGLASTSAFGTGTASASYSIAGGGHENMQAFGEGDLTYTITGTGLENVSVFGEGVVTGEEEAREITGTGLGSSLAFGEGALSASFTISGTGTANVSAYGEGDVTPSNQVAGTGFANASAFGTATLTASNTVSGTGYSNTSEYGQGELANVIRAAGIPSENAFGNGTLAPGAVTILGTGYANLVVFGGGQVRLAILSERIYRVPAESRTAVAANENRTLTVEAENRMNTVEEETRTLAIPAETRTYRVAA